MKVTGFLELNLLLLLLILTSMASSSTAKTSNVKLELPSDCPKNCGNISIDYPFGIGDGCFRPGFNLTCIHNIGAAAPRLYLGGHSTEVRSISVLHNEMFAQSPMFTMAEGEESVKASWKPVQIGSAALFYGGDTHRIYVAGCSIKATLVDLNNDRFTFGTCSSVCNATMTSKDACDGNDCCFIDQEPQWLTSMFLQLTRLDDKNATIVRAFATDIDRELTMKDIMELNETTTMEICMQWSITDQPSFGEAMKNEETYACLGSRRYSCYNSTGEVSGYFCQFYADLGFNPHLFQGCGAEPLNHSPQTNCSKKCGEVIVPYPFGVGQGCYRDENSGLSCSEADNDSLYIINNRLQGVINRLQVTNISIEDGQLTVKSSSYSTCHDTYTIGLQGNFGFLEDRGYSLDLVVAYESCQEAQINQTSYVPEQQQLLLA